MVNIKHLIIAFGILPFIVHANPDNVTFVPSNESMDAALKSYIQQLTANPEIDSIPAIKAILAKPKSYVTKVNRTAEGRYISFDYTHIAEKLAALNIPRWSMERPKVLLWVAIKDNNGLQLLNPDTDADICNTYINTLGSYGVKAMFPAFDFQDITSVSPQDVWGDYPSSLWTHSSRYGADILLVGNVKKNHDNYDATWHVLYANKEEKYRVTAANLTEGLPNAAATISASLIAKYGIVPTTASSNKSISLEIVGIKNGADFAAILNKINSLEKINSAKVAKLQGSSAYFTIDANVGSVEDIAGILMLEKEFLRMAKSNKSKVDLSYRWQAGY